jgi:hypothetical protein
MLGVQAKRASSNLWTGLIKPQLDASTAKINMPTFFDTMQQKIVAANPELSRQNSLLEALDAMKEDYSNVKDITLSKLQDFKKGWAKFVPDKAYRGKPIGGAFKEVQDSAAGLARTTIYDALGPEVKQAYFDYGNLQGIQELGQKAMAGGRFKGGFGGFWSAVKDTALTPVGTIGGQTIYKAGQGVEIIGKTGAQTVGQALNSLASPQSSPPTTALPTPTQ